MNQPVRPRPPVVVLIAVGLLAGATLGLQVALTRHFSFLYWHHFAFMIIGIGMLGFGAAGAWLARRGGVEAGPGAHALASRGAVAAAVALAVYLLAGPYMSFKPLRLLDDPTQFLLLFSLYVFMVVPFTGLGMAQGAILAGYRAWAHRVYAVDLIGAGLGCFLTLVLLGALSAPASLLAWAVCASFAGVLLSLGGSRFSRGVSWAVCGIMLLLLVTGWPDHRPFVPAPSKDMVDLYHDENGERRPKPLIDYTVVSPTIRLDVSALIRAPFLFGGNVSREWQDQLFLMRMVFQDAAAPTYLYSIDDIEGADFLGHTNQGLAYQIRPNPRVLVIGAGGGPDVMIALHHGAGSVTAVELNPQMMALGADRYSSFINGLYQRPNVIPVVSEGRHFLGRNRQRFDIVQMSGVDTFAALAAGAYAMSESYLYTVEAGTAVLDSLKPDGLFTNSRWYLYPPRETLRLVSVLLEALRLDGAEDPARHLLVVKADTWATTLLSRRPFSEEELEILRGWVARRGWRIVLDPDGSGSPPFVALVHGDATERAAFVDSYPYNVTPVTDDRPFFFQFYRWSHLLSSPESRGGYSITRIPVGYAVLGASLIQMAVLSALCIFGPLWSQRSRLRGHPGLARRFAFFAATGGGFMTIEIVSIQSFTVFMGHPIYSMSITLASLLMATGLGSFWAGRRPVSHERIVGTAVGAIIVWVALTVFLLKPMLILAIGWPLWSRALLTAGWLVPVGLALGMPFPTAIRALETQTPALVPWAWGANACLSVIASLASVLVAMAIGFRLTLTIAALIYLAGYLAWRATVRPPTTNPAER